MTIKYTVENFNPLEFGLPYTEESDIDILNKIQRTIKLDIEEAIADPRDILQGRGEPVHIGFDTEYEFNPETNENDIVIYCFYLIAMNRVLKGCVRPDGYGRKYRWTFKKLFGNILHIAKRENVITDYPSVTYIYSHFIRAEVGSWADFWDFSNKVQGASGTVTGPLVKDKDPVKSQLNQMRNGWGMGLDSKRYYRPEPVMLSDCGRHTFMTHINLVDTILLVPGRQGVDFIGKMVGKGKDIIPPQYHISRFKEFFEAEPKLATEYCINDAMLSVIYGLRIQDFCINTLGLKRVPTTIGGIAVAYFKELMGDKDYFNEVFGVRFIKSQQWDSLSSKVKKRHRKAETVSRRYHSQFFTDGFSGGLNISCYFGPTAIDKYYDVDLVSAYVISMLSIHPLDYAACYETKKPKDFIGELGMAHISFKFPEGTKQPSFAVRTELYGLIFPLEGECYTTAPEIENALNLGAEIVITHGVIVPQKRNEPRIFEKFVRWVRETRTAYDNKGETLLAELVKSVGNTLFGKTAGIKPTNFFDPITEDSKQSKPSDIANPYIASHITGFVRATLNEVMSRSAEKGFTVISGTTDGYLTDDPNVDLTGPLCRQYQELCDLIDGDDCTPGSMMKTKHWVDQVFSVKTRLQLTGKISSDRVDKEDKKIVLAKGSVKPPKEHNGVKLDNDEAKNEYMLNLALARSPGEKHDGSHFNSIRDQWRSHDDLIMIPKQIALNLEYDMKRRPVAPKMMPIGDTEHLAFDTVPWRNENEMQFARAVFDGWRKPTYPKKPKGQVVYTDEEIEKALSLANCLKTLDDYYRFEDFYLSHLSVDDIKGVNIKQCGSIGMLKRCFLIAYKKRKWGITEQDKTHPQLAEWLSENDYSTKADDVANAGRKNVRLIANVVPLTRFSLKLLQLILGHYPHFEYLNAFSQHIAQDVESESIALEIKSNL